jgi:hypothetical protein
LYALSKCRQVVANVKKIFMKSPTRIELFKIEVPDTQLPPTPIITHWGMWLLDVIVYHAENFEIFYSVINELYRDDASSVAILQDIFKDSNELKELKTDLAYIHANFSFVLQSITKLENPQIFCQKQ